MIVEDPTTDLRTMFNTVKTQLVDEFFMIKDDQEAEIIQRNKDLKEEVLQNFRTFDSIKNTLYKYLHMASSKTKQRLGSELTT